MVAMWRWIRVRDRRRRCRTKNWVPLPIVLAILVSCCLTPDPVIAEKLRTGNLLNARSNLAAVEQLTADAGVGTLHASRLRNGNRNGASSQASLRAVLESEIGTQVRMRSANAKLDVGNTKHQQQDVLQSSNAGTQISSARDTLKSKSALTLKTESKLDSKFKTKVPPSLLAPGPGELEGVASENHDAVTTTTLSPEEMMRCGAVLCGTEVR